MGARTNFIFKQGDNYITLYSHWGGETKLIDLAYAIEKSRPRWTDNGYSTRIMISQLIGSDWDNETGYGLYADALGGEESYDETIIDVDNQKVIHNGIEHDYNSFISYHLDKVKVEVV